MSKMHSFKKRCWEIVEIAKPGDKASRIFDFFIITLIFLNVIAVILGSVAGIRQKLGIGLRIFELISVMIFSIEYLVRVWSCITEKRFKGQFEGRVRYMFTPMAVVDLLSILPFFMPFIGVDLRSIRAMRLFRVVRLAKIGRYYSSLKLIKNVLNKKKEELILTSFIMILLLIFASTVVYECENRIQPDTFSSIPATMWWAIATLTTVGYGDMYPITTLGKLFASFIAMLGIGMFALPTGILGAGFIEEIDKKKKNNETKVCCPHCGGSLD